MLQMFVEADVGRPDQRSVKPALTDAGLAAGHQHDRPPLRIEGERHAPDAAIGGKAQFLMLPCFDPFSVSAWGRRNDGPTSHK